MLFVNSIVATLAFFLIISLSVKKLINCEPTKTHQISLIKPPDPLVEVDDEGPLRPTVVPLEPLDHTKSDRNTIDWLTDKQSTDQTISLTSPSVSSDIDYYPQITWGCPDCCEDDEIFIKSEQRCRKQSLINDHCFSSEQCIVPQSTCINQKCECIAYFFDLPRSKQHCTPIHDTAIEIYKITMIFASSCLALILLIFLACILRKSYCPVDSSLQGANRSTMNDLFTIYPGTSGSPNELFSSLTPTEKPPSYSETMRMINQEIGTPPPAYHIFYTETSSSSPPNLTQSTSTSTAQLPNQQNRNIVNNNDQQSTQFTNCYNGLSPVTPTTTTINAQNHNLYSTLNRPPPAIVSPPSTPLIVTLNNGAINSAFDCDS